MFFRRIIFFIWMAAPTLSLAADTSLAERLVSPVTDVREEATVEFHKLPLSIQERFVPSLMVAMNDENPEVRDQASRLIKELGVQARPQADPGVPASATAEASSQRDQERAQTLQTLQKSKTDRYQNLKSEMQSEKNAQPDWMAMKADSRSSDLKNTLLAGLGDPDAFIRSRSARRLSVLNPLPSEALPLLEAMLSDKDADCRSSAAIALSVYGSGAQGMAVKLGTLMNDPDEKVRIAAREALRQIQESR